MKNILTTIAALVLLGCGMSMDIWTMTIFQTFALCVLLVILLSSGCYCIWNGAYLFFNYIKPDFLSNPRFAYLHHRKVKLPIPAIALIRMFFGLPLLWGFWFFLTPSKWICPECDTYQIASKSSRYDDYYCINCNRSFEKVNKFRDGKPFYSMP